MTATVSIARGSVYISADTYARYFSGVDAVALIIRDGKLCILPVLHMASGGALLKIRNAKGDRVVSAPDLFAANGLENWTADCVTATWSSEQSALAIAIPRNGGIEY